MPIRFYFKCRCGCGDYERAIPENWKCPTFDVTKLPVAGTWMLYVCRRTGREQCAALPAKVNAESCDGEWFVYVA